MLQSAQLEQQPIAALMMDTNFSFLAINNIGSFQRILRMNTFKQKEHIFTKLLFLLKGDEFSRQLLATKYT